MRKISVMLVAAMLLSTFSIFAKEANANDPAKELKKQVERLLNGFSENASENDQTATILFTVNRENEIVVLSVYTQDYKLEKFVKDRLNYHRINSERVIEGRRYTIPVSIKS